MQTTKKIRIAVCGSRNYNDKETLFRVLNEIKDNIACIVSGGADGADKLAEKYSIENKVLMEIYLPDWRKHGRAAGILRNTDIINAADSVYAFWDGKSPGTLDSIKKAIAKKKQLVVVLTTKEVPRFLLQHEKKNKEMITIITPQD